ncbi:MAG TPA: HEAT repeat domain-containing protein [Pyrinomonadaceae bacterium]|jgi:HEAT repeat protein
MGSEAEKQNFIGIFTTDTEFIVQIWDAALERMTGIAAADARGRSIVETIPNLETRGLLARFKRVLDDGTIEVLAPAFHRFLIPCPPGSDSPHFAEMRQRVTIAPLKEGDAVRGLIVTVEDVTARIEREIKLAEQLKNSDETVRLEAAKALSEKPDNLVEETAAPLIDALGDENWRVRRELVDGLARRAAPDAIAALLRAMKDNHFDFGVLNSALQVLQATSVRTTETLIEFLRCDDEDLRMQAALTLGEQRDAQAIPALVAALGDENVNVRYHSIEALGKMKTPRAVEPLLEIAESRDFFLSFAALDALREIADEAAAPRILPLLNDDFLREAAVETFGAIGDEGTVVPLVHLLNEEKATAAAVAQALAAIAARRAADPAKSAAIIESARAAIDAAGKSNLRGALASARAGELAPLIRVAGWFDDASLREKLAALLEDENAADEAARALMRQGAAAVDLLIEKFGDVAADGEVRRTIARLLGQIGDARAFEPLAGLLKSPDAATRQAAVDALRALAHPATVSRLCDLLDDDDPQIREAVIRVVGHLDAPNCAEKIFEACADADERVRRAAIEQLPEIADARAVPTLIQALKHDSPRVRETAAKALAKVPSGESLVALRDALRDADAWTRYFAVRALGVRRDAASAERLAEMTDADPAEFVRAAAREVLKEFELE